MTTRSAMLAAAVLVGTVQVEFEGKTYVLSGGENRVLAENQGAPRRRKPSPRGPP